MFYCLMFLRLGKLYFPTLLGGADLVTDIIYCIKIEGHKPEYDAI